jgi:hypothetical protein
MLVLVKSVCCPWALKAMYMYITEERLCCETFEYLLGDKDLATKPGNIVSLAFTRDLLKKAFEYAKNYVKISPDKVKIILQTKKALLYADSKPWIKRGNKVLMSRWAPGMVPRWQTLWGFISFPS